MAAVIADSALLSGGLLVVTAGIVIYDLYLLSTIDWSYGFGRPGDCQRGYPPRYADYSP